MKERKRGKQEKACMALLKYMTTLKQFKKNGIMKKNGPKNKKKVFHIYIYIY